MNFTVFDNHFKSQHRFVNFERCDTNDWRESTRIFRRTEAVLRGETRGKTCAWRLAKLITLGHDWHGGRQWSGQSFVQTVSTITYRRWLKIHIDFIGRKLSTKLKIDVFREENDTDFAASPVQRLYYLFDGETTPKFDVSATKSTLSIVSAYWHGLFTLAPTLILKWKNPTIKLPLSQAC